MEPIDNSLLNLMQPFTNKNIILTQIPNIHIHLTNHLLAMQKVTQSILFENSNLTIIEISLLNRLPALFIYTNSLQDLSYYITPSTFNWTSLTTINYANNTRINNKCYKFENIMTLKSLEEFNQLSPSILLDIYTSKKKTQIFSIKKNYKKLTLKNRIEDKLLVAICKAIISDLRNKKELTYKELADHIITLTIDTIDNSTTDIYKNIQRRVYDIINVLKALNVVKREKNVVIFNEKIIEKEIETNALKTLIKRRKRELYRRVTQLAFCKLKMQKNKNSYTRVLTQEKIYGEFFLVKVDEQRKITIRHSQDKKRLVVLSNSELKSMTYDDIIMSLSSFEPKKEYLEGVRESVSHSCFDYLTDTNYYNEYFTPTSFLNIKRKQDSGINLIPNDEKACFSKQGRFDYFNIKISDNNSFNNNNNAKNDSLIKKDESRSFASSTNFNSKNSQ